MRDTLIIPFSPVLLGLLSWPTSAQDRKCYTPDGSDRNANFTVTTYEPCSNDTVSMCCATAGTGSDHCNPNGTVGICYNYIDDVYWRESCTDQTWKDPACIKLFVNGTGYDGGGYTLPDEGYSDVEITPCPDGSFCSGFQNYACCDQGEGVFINYSSGDTQPENPNPTSTTTAPSTTSAAPASSTTSSSTPSHTSSPSKTLSGGAIAGIAIGAAIVVVLLAMAGWWFCVHKRRKTTSANNVARKQHRHPEAEKKSFPKYGYHQPTEMDSFTSGPRHELPAEESAQKQHQQQRFEM